MEEAQENVNHAAEVARQATHFDASGSHQAAIYMYRQAAEYLQRAMTLGLSTPALQDHAMKYKERADQLENLDSQAQSAQNTMEGGQSELSRANFLLLEAFEEDEAGNMEEAIEHYTNAVQLCLEAMKTIEDPKMSDKLRKLAEQALTRAEVLKAQSSPEEEQKASIGEGTGASLSSVRPAHQRVSPTRVIPPLGIGNLVNSRPQPQAKPGPSSKSGLQLSGSAGYTKEELEVLRRTSNINGRDYVPFLAVDLKEKFAYSLPFTDKDGVLALAPKQKKNFLQWVRPEDLSSDPKMIEMVDCFSIKQTCVSDCSFVASVAISALYEKRFKKRLITDIIFPKNRSGDPIYNPCGKYMIKLHINGIPRKVIVDDKLPQGQHGELLCSYSTNKNEFWISLVEKAYMKVMGGYDFPGSNSNIDLYALTGWIPERVSIKDKEFNKDATFRKIIDRFHRGDVLVTVATGEMSDADADRAGLVPTHAYAMLDIKEVKGKRLLMLKNPWSHLRWKGNYSEMDQTHWTPEMCKLLNYDPKSAQMFDNGVFWIDYDSLCHFYDVIYMNWNPQLFSYTYCTHETWSAGTGPVRDLYNIGENPQYSLDVQSPGGTAVWVLLTRHITEIEDFRNNKEYITLLVYKTGGKKIFYPFDPAPFIDGVRINSPHYLCKMVLKEPGSHKFTLVVSQYEKHLTIHYSLRVYATCPFTLQKIKNYCKHKQEITGRWSGANAGGCPNHPATYKNNPTYQFRVEHEMQALRIELKAPKDIQIGFEIVCVEAKNTEASSYFTKKQTGAYRSGFVVLEIMDVVPGVYNVTPSTFYPNTEAPYFLNFFSSAPVKVSKLK
ncbi:Calpain-7 [Penaeus vannamei]|uniref:Calpain-7 n=1 Tax=Penaeus vannamei TaxID=6689 RepID=A0A3R7M8V8_PENVA|nr:calpain-7-like [Penaeus vannamei]ROT76129.1 Calpain-7 [Penaeus vannamei]